MHACIRACIERERETYLRVCVFTCIYLLCFSTHVHHSSQCVAKRHSRRGRAVAGAQDHHPESELVGVQGWGLGFRV